jgi:hypothetical protein
LALLALCFLVFGALGILLFCAKHLWHSPSLCFTFLVLYFSMLGAWCFSNTFFFSVLGVLGTLLLYMFSVLGVLLLCVWHYWHFVSLYLTLCFLKA